MSTTWWAQSIQSESNWAQFDKAVDDVQWVINQIIDLLKAILAPLAPLPSGTSQAPIPSLGATWMSCADGKRQPRPSCRLLEAGGG